MQSENRILGNQLVVMSREDLDALINEMAKTSWQLKQKMHRMTWRHG